MQKRLKQAIFAGGPTPPPVDPLSPIQKLEALRKDMPQVGYIRQAGLLAILPFSSATLWRWVQKGDFPKPTKLGPRVTAWRIDEVRRWLGSNG
uniref:AlpA family phage regulatory protein n=1 Tax=Calothrix sp. FACHB-1219 TaxID=2692778 RepID=UPI0018EFFFAF